MLVGQEFLGILIGVMEKKGSVAKYFWKNSGLIEFLELFPLEIISLNLVFH